MDQKEIKRNRYNHPLYKKGLLYIYTCSRCTREFFSYMTYKNKNNIICSKDDCFENRLITIQNKRWQ